MTDKLLPCPFCGGPAKSYFVTGMAYHFWAGCDECGVHTRVRSKDDLGSRDTEAEAKAIAKWNRRTPPPQTNMTARAEALEEAAKLGEAKVHE